MDQRENDLEPGSRWPRRLSQVALALVLVAAGVAAGILWSERRGAPTRAAPPAGGPSGGVTAPAPPAPVPASPTTSAGTSTEPVEVSLTADAIA
ncbi:MAG: hypothetical protein ACREKS_19475, partial [Candidatus Rokuibacteriota bacterium]